MDRKAIGILVVDYSGGVYRRFVNCLEREPDIKTVGYAQTVDEAVEKVDRYEIALISAQFRKDGAHKLTRSVIEAKPNIKVLIIGRNASKKEIIQYIEAGAFGYLTRKDTPEKLLKNIRAIQSGKSLLPPDLVAALMSRLAKLSCEFEGLAGLERSEISSLTMRERQILSLIGQAYSNQEIADKLVIEVGTVKNHVHNILSKLNVRTRYEAAAYLSSIVTKTRRKTYAEAH